MDIRITKIKKVLPILAIPFLLGVKCNKDDPRPCPMLNSRYSFSVIGIFSPQRENYNVGDTIYYHSSFPVKLTDRTSNTEIDYSNSVGIEGRLSFVMIDSVKKEVVPSSHNFFAIVGKVIQVDKDSTGLNYYYQTGLDSFKVSIAIRLLSKGLYRFGVSDLHSKGIWRQNCSSAGFDMFITNSNKNFHLHENGLGITPDALAAPRIFCFRVR
jgi:hypothetical protein